MENKEIEVNVEGMENQRREQILNSDRYVDIRVVVGEDYSEPVVQANVKGNPVMVATALACLRDVEKTLKKRSRVPIDPLIDMIQECMTSTVVDVDKEDK